MDDNHLKNNQKSINSIKNSLNNSCYNNNNQNNNQKPQQQQQQQQQSKPLSKQRKLVRSPEVSIIDIPTSVVTTVANVMGGSGGFIQQQQYTIDNNVVDLIKNKQIINPETTTTNTIKYNRPPLVKYRGNSFTKQQGFNITASAGPKVSAVEQSAPSASTNNQRKSIEFDLIGNAGGSGNKESYSIFPSGSSSTISGYDSITSEEQELSLLSNLNIDSSISEITYLSDSGSVAAEPIAVLSADSGATCCETSATTYDSSGSASTAAICLQTPSTSAESPIKYADCDDNSTTMGSDLSTAGSSSVAKLTSGNTSLSGESNTISSTSGGLHGLRSADSTDLNGSSAGGGGQPTLQRLQNFLFSKSNDSVKSFDGPLPSSSSQIQSPFSPRQQQPPHISATATQPVPSYSQEYDDNYLSDKFSSDQGYYHPIASPNNPFLPEIIAKTYITDEDEDPNDDVSSTSTFARQPSTEDCNSKSLDRGSSIGLSPSTSPHKEKHSWFGGSSSKTHSTTENDISTGTTKKGKLFSLSSPTSEHGFSQKFSKFSPQSSVKRSFNPFSRSNEINQAELNAKREEFLKATMKICLVVSPPSSKLQLKSKSLTHLDVLDSMVACHQGSTAPQKPQSDHLDISPNLQNKGTCSTGSTSPTVGATTRHPFLSTATENNVILTGSGGIQHYHQHHQSISSTNSNSCNKICCLGQTTTTTTINSNVSGSGSAISSCNNSGVLAATLSAASIHPVGLTATSNTQLQTQLNICTHHGGSVKKKSFISRKKPLLTRSEVSSSEYFSVNFCTEIGCNEEVLFSATKGKSLSEALNSALKKRNLDFSQITISDNNFQSFNETGSPPYTSSLDENTDTEHLAGKCLVVVEKDSVNACKRATTLQKAASFGSRTRPPRLLSSASTEETTLEFEQKIVPGKQLKQRWSGLFGIKNPHQAQLYELLNKYDREGVPQKLSSMKLDHPDYSAIEYLKIMHKSWRDFVKCDNMTDNEVKIQSAIWELVSTEIDYIHALKTVTDLFLACLEAIQKERILIEIDQMKLFSNIRELCEANLKFWIQYLYPMVAHSIQTKEPLCIDYFQPGFVTFATTFSPYKKYCAEQSTCQFYCKDLNRNNALFTAYLAWCESQKMCNRLRLADILVRPMQRLTKYSLLLTAIRKHIVDENEADIVDSMIHSVENFVYSVNTHLTTRQENERLKGIMARIESYDVVDVSNEQLEKFTKQYSQMFDLCAPMKGCSPSQGRHLFMEGDLKLKDNIGKSDVHCFLLTDILLICKTIAKKGQGTLKVIRQPYLTDRLVIKHKDNTLYCVYLNEFQVAVTAFTLQCGEAKNWHDSLTKAKHIYSRLKQGPNWDNYNLRGYGQSSSSDNANMLGVKKSPMNSSIGSRVSSLNNSHSGSVELNDSRNISVDFEKANSLSSDEGSAMNNQMPQKSKNLSTSHHKQLQQQKAITSNTLSVQPLNNLGQSLPNLNLNHGQVSCNLYHTYSNNTLHVPGHGVSISGNNLLSPSHRGISYPPPSPTRTLRRGFAFSSSIKNPPLVKTRNITSQNSIINYQQSTIPTNQNNQAPNHGSNSLVAGSTGGNCIPPAMSTGLQINQESDV